MKTEYDFSNGVRGKYYRDYAAGSNIIVLDEDVMKAFPDSAAVNDALRRLIDLARKTAERPIGKAAAH